MCTCITFKAREFYFGRNLDLEYSFGEKVVVTPKKYQFKLKNNTIFQTKYAIIGMATVYANYPLYADATNEEGLSIAGLYFPGNAVYNDEKENCDNIASFELIHINISAKLPENKFSKDINLKPYGQGMGMIGLPGDVTPTSRFVRATFNKFNSITDEDEESCVSQFFHILDSVSMIKGTVITKENKNDMTIYSSCINTTKGIYYFKTYYNNQIHAVALTKKNMDAEKLEIYELPKKQNINYLNMLDK